MYLSSMSKNIKIYGHQGVYGYEWDDKCTARRYTARIASIGTKRHSETICLPGCGHSGEGSVYSTSLIRHGKIVLNVKSI